MPRCLMPLVLLSAVSTLATDIRADEPAADLAALVKQLGTGSHADQDETMRTLAAAGEKAVPHVLVAFRSADFTTFVRAARVFSEMQQPPVEVLTDVRKTLHSDDPERRRIAIILLKYYGVRGGELLPDVLPALTDEDFHLRYAACITLGAMGPAAAKAVPNLLTASHDKVTSVRGHAMLALGSIGPVEGHDIVARLAEATGDRHASVRERALTALAGLGPRAKATLPRLRELVADDMSDEPVYACRAAWRVGMPVHDIVERLVVWTADFDHNLEAIQLLGEIGPEAKPAVDTLKKLLDSEDPDVRFETLSALSKIAPADSRPVLERAAERDADPELRARAKRLLDPSENAVEK